MKDIIEIFLKAILAGAVMVALLLIFANVEMIYPQWMDCA